jgi:signal transduction histidine kinase
MMIALRQHYRNASLRLKLLIALLAVMVISVFSLSFINDRITRSQLTEEAGETLYNLANSKAQTVGDLLAKQVESIEALAVNRTIQEGVESLGDGASPGLDIPALRGLDGAWQSTGDDDPWVVGMLQGPIAIELLKFRNAFPDNFEILLTDRTGQLLAATNRPQHYYFGEADWWQTAYQNGRGRLYLESSSEGDSVTIAVPVYGRTTNVVFGVLYARSSLDVLFDVLVFERLEGSGFVALIFPDGNIFAAEELRLEQAALSQIILNDLAALETSSGFLEMELNGVEGFASAAPVKTADPGTRLSVEALGWRVIAFQDAAIALQPVNASIRLTIVTGLFALVLAGVLAVGLADWMARPISRFSEITRQIAGGDLSAHVEFDSGDELGTLARNFNAMTAQLRANLDEIQHQARIIQTSAGIARAATATLDSDAILTTSAEQIRERFGLYFVGIFIHDPASNMMRLRAATGVVGERLIEQDFALPLNAHSLVGKTALEHKPHITQDVNLSEIFYEHPYLLETHAEAVIPLFRGETLLGVLDLQSDSPHVFGAELIEVLTSLADQIAIALQNATLFEVQKSTVARLQELDRLKTEFLTVMSHELRTPLNSIIGFSRLLMKGVEGPLNEIQEQDVTIIYNNSQHLLRLINDILDHSRILANKMELAYETVDLPRLLSDAVATTRPLLGSKPIEIDLQVSDTLPKLEADRLRLNQIILNLMSNAAKFTESGKITVSADEVQGAGFARNGGSDPAKWCRIRIQDTGIGIPQEHLRHLFEPFSQADASITRRSGGTGLGLSITNRLVQLHGGSISVESRVNRGSTFTVTLPAHPPVEHPPHLE